MGERSLSLSLSLSVRERWIGRVRCVRWRWRWRWRDGSGEVIDPSPRRTEEDNINLSSFTPSVTPVLRSPIPTPPSSSSLISLHKINIITQNKLNPMSNAVDLCVVPSER